MLSCISKVNKNMDAQLIKELIKYVKDTLDITLVIQPWNGRADLPFFLRDQYAFHQTKIMTLPCILMVANSKQETTPAVIRKNIDLLRPRTGKAEIIYIRKQLNSFNRKSWLSRRFALSSPAIRCIYLFWGWIFENTLERCSQSRIY